MDKINNEEGIKMLPLIWTVFLSQSKDLWAEPFSNRKLRHRCFFEKISGLDEKLTVYFHLSKNEQPKDFSPLPKTTYFYGAFNQIDVYQIRSFGKLREMFEEEKIRYTNLITERMSGKKLEDELPLTTTIKEAHEALKQIQSGNFYVFEPLEYAYKTYKRG